MKLKNLGVLAKYALVLMLCLGCTGLLSPLTYAQSTYGSVSGQITDASGGAIADVKVTLTNLETGAKLSENTGTDGLYLFSNLFQGHYRLDAEKTGFKHIAQTDVVVQLQQTSAINLTMQLGEVTQTVEVTSETPLLQPDTSSLGQVIDERKANEIPLNGRNVFNLALLSPSVIPQGNTLGTTVGKNPFDTGNYQIGGAFANQAVEYLDGQPLNIGYINLPLVVPTQDTIGEFKVQYNNQGPEWGKFAGGVINFSTKSGSNQWHGEAYEFLRNRVLDANEAFLKGSQILNKEPNKAPPFTQNQFGGNGGGAIFKDKTFVFGSYEGFRARVGTVFSTVVPSATEATGNFADLCQTGFTTPKVVNGTTYNVCSDKDKNGNLTHQLYDPLSVTGAPSTVGTPRVPFVNNMIPSGLINPTAAFLLGKLVPGPTNPSVVPSSGNPNFIKGASTGGNIDEYVARVDQNLTQSQRLFGRFTYFKQLSLAQDPFGTGLCKDRCAENTRSKSLAVGWSDAISPTFTASVNISASRFHYLRGPINSGFDVTKEGWPAAYNPIIPDTERTPMTPCFSISDNLVSCSQGQSAINDFDTQWNLSPQFTKVVGRHTIAFGGQLEETYDNYLQTNTGGGLISFSGSWTAPLTNNSPVLGNDYADFLLGFGLGAGAANGNQTSGSLVVSAPVAGKETYRALYVGDTWHLTNKLTLNLGLRYELPGAWSERFDRLTYFDPKATNASITGCGGTVGSSCAGDLFYVGTGRNGGRNNLPLKTNEWSPRLGFAYAFNPKTVFRGGYGIFYTPNFVSFAVNPYIDPTASATSTFISGVSSGFLPASSLNGSNCTLQSVDNLVCTTPGPFGPNLNAPVGRNAQPNISAYGLAQLSGLSSAAYTRYNPSYVQQWNIDIQRELPWGIFADIAYAGAHGVHLQQFNTNINQIPDSFITEAQSQYLAGGAGAVTIAQAVTPANYPFPAGAYPPNSSLGLGQLKVAQLARPFPQYTGVNLNGYGCCSSSYNSLQVSATKRFHGGGTILVAYTNAKLLTNTDSLTSWLEGSGNGGVGSVQDWNNLKGERSLSSQDVPQRLVISYVYDLPFGHGQKFFSDASGIADKIVSGWGIDGVTSFQRGFPLKITDGTGNLLTALGAGIGTLRPNVVPGCNKKAGGGHVNQWFNTTCFVTAQGYTFGDESRADATLRQQGVNNWDFAVFKRTYFGPDNRFNLEFRTEFFNIVNKVQFAAPNTNLASSQFGVVSATNTNPRLIQFGLKFAF